MRAHLNHWLAAAMLLTLALGLVAACGKKNEPDQPGGAASTFGRPYPRQ
jgi:hypothetical protein